MIVDTEKLQNDAAYSQEMRHRAITDHFFLAELMGFRDFIPRIHRPAVDLYFPKNPKIAIADQHHIKNRLHLDPRYTFKTTLGRVDTLQWIIAFPEEISILNESATQPLAAQISQKVAEYFWKPKGKAATVLQAMFPELVTERRPDADWSTPNRKLGEIDNTLAFTSPKTQQSGWHPWILNPDDMVDTTNSGINASNDSRQSVIDTYNTNRFTLRPGGYLNVRGTRYHPFDLYGVILEKMDPAEWRTLIRGALTVKSGARIVPGEFPEEEEVILHFPEMTNLTYKKLRSLFYEDYESFMCQLMNDPQGGHIPTFDEKLYETTMADPDHIPMMGENVMCWRLTYGGKEYTQKYAEGAVARINNGRAYVLDAWQGIYTPSGLAEKIIREAKRYEVEGIMMEALPGVEFMATHIRNESYKKNYPIRIQWLEFEEDDNTRFSRIRQLEPVMRQGKIAISTAITKSQEVRRQFLHFGLVVENGIADCISRLMDRIPLNMLRSAMDEEELEAQIRARENLHFQAVFGQEGFGQEGMEFVAQEVRAKMEAHISAMEQVNSFGLTPMPGGLDG